MSRRKNNVFHERIKNSDLINEKQYPVKVVFDEISDEEFISIINSVSKGEDLEWNRVHVFFRET